MIDNKEVGSLDHWFTFSSLSLVFEMKEVGSLVHFQFTFLIWITVTNSRIPTSEHQNTTTAERISQGISFLSKRDVLLEVSPDKNIAVELTLAGSAVYLTGGADARGGTFSTC